MEDLQKTELIDGQKINGDDLYREYKYKRKAYIKKILGIVGLSVTLVLACAVTPVSLALIGIKGASAWIISAFVGGLLGAMGFASALYEIFRIGANSKKAEGLFYSRKKYKNYQKYKKDMKEVNAQVNALQDKYKELINVDTPYEYISSELPKTQDNNVNDVKPTIKTKSEDKANSSQKEDGRDL